MTKIRKFIQGTLLATFLAGAGCEQKTPEQKFTPELKKLEKIVKEKIPKPLSQKEMADEKGPLSNLSPEEVVIACGYFPYSANTNSIANAEVVLIGDEHPTNNFPYILERLATKGDQILVEISPQEIIGKVLTQQNKFIASIPKIESIINDNRNQTSSDYKSRTKEIKRTYYDLTDIQDRLGEATRDILKDNLKFMTDFAFKKRIPVIPIDIPEEGKDRVFENMIFDTILPMESIALRLNVPLHPFGEWVLYDDRKATKRTNDVTTQVKEIEEYERQNKVGCSQGRQQIIVNNMLNAIEAQKTNRLYSSSKTFIIYGSQHITGYSDLGMAKVMASRNIPYIAFTPKFEENRSKATENKKGELFTSGSLSIDHFTNTVIPSYIGARISQNDSPPYTGSFEGLREHVNDLHKRVLEYEQKSKK